MKRLLIACLLAAALLGGGCGNSEDRAEGSRQTTAGKDESQPPPAPKGAWAEMEEAAGPAANRLLIPRGSPPKDLVIRNLRIGDGPVIQRGDWFTANYAAYYYETGSPREENWGGHEFHETWGGGILVDAWEPGLKGMRVGGVRELIAPARLAYGDEALVYLIKLRSLEEN